MGKRWIDIFYRISSLEEKSLLLMDRVNTKGQMKKRSGA